MRNNGGVWQLSSQLESSTPVRLSKLTLLEEMFPGHIDQMYKACKTYGEKLVTNKYNMET